MQMPLPAKTIDPRETTAVDPVALDTSRGAVSGAGNDPFVARALQIATVLQTSLDVEQIVRLFSREVRVTVPHRSLSYRKPECNIELSLGNPAQHSCTYRLVVARRSAGEITITRHQPFSSTEISELEYLLCSLVYPLLNALSYKDAVECARRDGLTGLHNRLAIDEAMQREIKLAHRYKTPLSLIVIDIDDFKTINDRHGHGMGDRVIQCVARQLSEGGRESDLVGRYGGEEFVVLLSNTDLTGARQVAERMRRAVAVATCTIDDQPLEATVSAGVATLADGEDGAAVFERADRALYEAKAAGKDRVVAG
jgi:diguanylate cyclase (GGDEF)-like protein